MEGSIEMRALITGGIGLSDELDIGPSRDGHEVVLFDNIVYLVQENQLASGAL